MCKEKEKKLKHIYVIEKHNIKRKGGCECCGFYSIYHAAKEKVYAITEFADGRKEYYATKNVNSLTLINSDDFKDNYLNYDRVCFDNKDDADEFAKRLGMMNAPTIKI